MSDTPDRAPSPQEEAGWQAPQPPPRPELQGPAWPTPTPPHDWRQQYPPQYVPQDWRTQYPPGSGFAPRPVPPRAPRPPGKWLGAWGGLWIALGAVGIIVVEFVEAWLLRDVQRPSPSDYDVLDPNLLLVGSGCVIAGFLYTLAYRVPTRWRLPLGRLIGGGLLAGFLAAVAAGAVNGLIDAFAGGTAESPSTLAFALVGFVEESAKLAAALLLGRSLPVKNGRVGLFVGAAVGFGFAAVENLGYLQIAWSVGLAHHDALGSTLGTAIVRQLMGPLLHPVMTGLVTAAVFAMSRGGRYRLTFGVIGAWLAVAVAHSLFDLGSSAADSLRDRDFGAGIALLTVFGYLVAAFLAWLLISRGLKRRDLARAQGEAEQIS